MSYSLEDLPADVLLFASKQLTMKDVLNLSICSKKLNKIFRNAKCSFWKNFIPENSIRDETWQLEWVKSTFGRDPYKYFRFFCFHYNFCDETYVFFCDAFGMHAQYNMITKTYEYPLEPIITIAKEHGILLIVDHFKMMTPVSDLLTAALEIKNGILFIPNSLEEDPEEPFVRDLLLDVLNIEVKNSLKPCNKEEFHELALKEWYRNSNTYFFDLDYYSSAGSMIFKLYQHAFYEEGIDLIQKLIEAIRNEVWSRDCVSKEDCWSTMLKIAKWTKVKKMTKIQAKYIHRHANLCVDEGEDFLDNIVLQRARTTIDCTWVELQQILELLYKILDFDLNFW